MDNGRSGSRGKPINTGDLHVQEVVRAAHEELRQLMRQRAEVMKRIGTVKQTIVGLANLFGDAVLNDELLELVDRKSGGRQPGFTKACRMVLMEANKPLGAREVCDQIQQRMPPILLRLTRRCSRRAAQHERGNSREAIAPLAAERPVVRPTTYGFQC